MINIVKTMTSILEYVTSDEKKRGVVKTLELLKRSSISHVQNLLTGLYKIYSFGFGSKFRSKPEFP